VSAPGYIGTSQNGWPVYDDDHFRDHAVRITVAGVAFWAASSDVAVVLGDFTQKYNDTIESITLPVKEAPGYDDWSRALRPVRGQTSGYSNHASITAWDLNSSRHPRGVHNTYSAAHRKVLHALVNDDLYLVGGLSVLRDGEFYNSTIDGMHIEINAGPSAVKIVADRIRNLSEGLTVVSLSKADVAKLIHDEVLNVLRKEEFIPNTPLDGTKASGNWTVQGVLEKADQKADRANANDNAQNDAIAALTAKVDKLTELVTAFVTTPAPATPTKGQ
jgi:hypothetical protein